MMTIHGEALNIYDCGTLLTGDNAIGKSDIALELISRGHKFIADDAVSINKTSEQLDLTNTSNQFIMHIRGIGFINIEQVFGSNATIAISKLDLIIHLSNTPIEILDPLVQPQSKKEILNIAVTEYVLPFGKNRPIVCLIETIVKYHLQLQNGIDSHNTFIKQHNQSLLEMT